MGCDCNANFFGCDDAATPSSHDCQHRLACLPSVSSDVQVSCGFSLRRSSLTSSSSHRRIHPNCSNVLKKKQCFLRSRSQRLSRRGCVSRISARIIAGTNTDQQQSCTLKIGHLQDCVLQGSRSISRASFSRVELAFFFCFSFFFFFFLFLFF